MQVDPMYFLRRRTQRIVMCFVLVVLATATQA